MDKTQIQQDLLWLTERDERLHAVCQVSGDVLPRSRPPGFPGLARIICGQQLSVASADAIWGRLVQLQGHESPQRFLSLQEEAARQAGLSRSKIETIRTVAHAMQAGELDLAGIAALPAEQAIAQLTHYKGIGPWTAEIYLMFCAAHPDIFPAGDLALRRAVGEAFGIEPHPGHKDLAEIAAQWAPRRSSAALLFWRYYAATRKRDALPV